MKMYQPAMFAMHVLLGAQLAACEGGSSGGAEGTETQATTSATEAPDPGLTEASEPGTSGGLDDAGGADASGGAETSGGSDTSGDDSNGDDTSNGPPDDSSEINAYIKGLGHLSVAPPAPAQQIECEGDQCLEDGEKDDYTCDYTHYTVTENYDDFVAFQPNSAALWPGSIVEGEDASQGLLTAIGLPRAPLTFSVSLPGLANSTGHLEAPTLSTFRNELEKVAGDFMGETPASLSFELRQVFSEAELSLALKTSVKWPGGSNISAMFSLDTEQSKTHVVANFVQSYFTVDMDTPLQPADLFSPEVTVEQLGDFMAVDNPPMYVQSMTYGRRAVFSIESTHSAEEVQAALDVTIKAGVEGYGEVDLKTKKVLSESTMQVFVQGGSAEDGIHVVDGFEGLMTFIKNGAEYSSDSPAAVIAYKLAYLDNYGTRFAYTTDFAESDCTLTPDKVRVAVDEIYFHANGCDWKDTNCNQTYKIWAETSASPGTKHTLASQDVSIKIGDGQTINLGAIKDFVLPDENGSWLTVGFSAEEDGLTVSAEKTFEYQNGWQGLGQQGITGKTPKKADEDLDVTVSFKVSEL